MQNIWDSKNEKDISELEEKIIELEKELLKISERKCSSSKKEQKLNQLNELEKKMEALNSQLKKLNCNHPILYAVNSSSTDCICLKCCVRNKTKEAVDNNRIINYDAFSNDKYIPNKEEFLEFRKIYDIVASRDGLTSLSYENLLIYKEVVDKYFSDFIARDVVKEVYKKKIK